MVLFEVVAIVGRLLIMCIASPVCVVRVKALGSLATVVRAILGLPWVVESAIT